MEALGEGLRKGAAAAGRLRENLSGRLGGVSGGVEGASPSGERHGPGETGGSPRQVRGEGEVQRFGWLQHSATEAEINDALLQRLDPGYLTQDFDATQHVLRNLPRGSADKGHYLEDRAGEVTLRHEMVTQMLYGHIMKNYSIFVQGLSEVANLGDRLQEALVLARNTRQSLLQVSNDVKMSLSVAASATKKQNYLKLTDSLVKLQDLPTLTDEIRLATEAQRYAAAISKFVETYDALTDLTELACCVDMRVSMEGIGQDILREIDGKLQAVCTSFEPGVYAEIATSYRTLDDVAGLCDKMQACFSQAILTQTHSVVQSYVMQEHLQQAAAFKDKPMSELCALLRPNAFQDCLLQTMDVIFDALVNHHAMVTWHEEQIREGGGALSPVFATVSESLLVTKNAAWEHAARRVGTLLSSPSASSVNLYSLVELAFAFLFIGESFIGAPAAAFRKQMEIQISKLADIAHQRTLQSIHKHVLNETWQRTAGGGAFKQQKVMQFKFELHQLRFAAVPFQKVLEDGKPFVAGRSPASILAKLIELVADGDAAPGKAPAFAPAEDDLTRMTASTLFGLICVDQNLALLRNIDMCHDQIFLNCIQAFEAFMWGIVSTFGDQAAINGAARGVGSLTPRLEGIIRRVLQEQGQFSAKAGNNIDQSYQKRAKMMFTSGNLYGLIERSVAVEALHVLAQYMRERRSEAGAGDVEDPKVEQFYSRTLPAVEDLDRHMLSHVAKLLLLAPWLADRVASTKYDLKEVGVQHSKWVDDVLAEFRSFGMKLGVVDIPEGSLDLLWHSAVEVASGGILTGLAKVKKCTFEGRAAMSLDLQVLASGLKQTRGDFEPNLVLLDDYVKAFYTPAGELEHWLMTHLAQYSAPQLQALLKQMEAAGLVEREAVPALLATVADMGG